jgi:drug/metabolite transporter (DMT)-like permease
VSSRCIGDVLVSDSTRVIANLGILLVLAALAGAFALVLFSALGRVESRAHWRREKGLARSRRLERRAFGIGVVMVVAMVVAGLTIYLNRTPPCKGTIVIVTGPNGAPLECLCEQEKRGACFDPGP